jgi:thiol:disulfide interchange protein
LRGAASRRRGAERRLDWAPLTTLAVGLVACGPAPPSAPPEVAIAGAPLAVEERAVRAERRHPSPRSIDWHDDLSTARRAARAAGRPLLIYAHAAWDVASREALREVWSDEQVIAEAASFVALSLDASDSDDAAMEHDLATLRIDRIPTVVVLTPAGSEERRLEGAMTRETLLELLAR